MAQQNPYESPQVTELSQSANRNLIDPEIRDLKFLEHVFGSEWRSIKKGTKFCVMAVGIALAGSLISLIGTMMLAITKIAVGNGLERIFIVGAVASLILGCVLHIVGLYNLRKVIQSRTRLLLTIALIAFLAVTACVVFQVFFYKRFSAQFVAFVESNAYVIAVWLAHALHNFFLLLAFLDIATPLQERKLRYDLAIATGLFSLTTTIVFVNEVLTEFAVSNIEWLSRVVLIIGTLVTVLFYCRGLQKITNTISKIEKNIPQKI